MRRERQRLSFGSVAELYDRARPSYPAQLVDELLELAGAGGGAAGSEHGVPGRGAPAATEVGAGTGKALRALEVGAGTGKATVLLAARGVRVDALEPIAEMAALARRNLAAYPNVAVIEAEFESYVPEPSGGAYDLLYSAQAWHWMDPQLRYRRARALLREGGLLAAFWNRPDWSGCELGEAIDAAYRRHAPELAEESLMCPGDRRTAEEWQGWSAEIAAAEGFREPEVRAYRWRSVYSSEGYASLLRTHSDHIVMEAARREALIGAVAAAIERAGGAFELPRVTLLCLAHAA